MWASLVAQLVKNLPAMQETQVRSLGQEDSLEKEMATHSSILAWEIPMNRGAWRAMVHGDFPGKNTGVGCHFLLQGVFLIQGLDLSLLYCRWILLLTEL